VGCHGQLERLDFRAHGKNIAVPTLVINGVNEGASDEAIKPFLEMIPVVKWVQLKDSTHCPHWEDRDKYIQTAGKWLMSK
jgi:pimeloyl-ACP methyl ester carboxylesterase